jgi:DNA-binding transcriptional ArsR family regulator
VLSKRPGQELPAFPAGDFAASQVLREAGLISVRLEKNRRLYRVRADRLAELRAMLDEFWGGRLASLRAELAARERGARQ